jgi:hypothetical protein
MQRKTLLLALFSIIFIFSGLAKKTSEYKIKNGQIEFIEHKRQVGQTTALQLRCDPIPTVRIAFIGLGMRGSEALRRFMYQEGVEVVALCDVNKDFVKRAQKVLADNHKKPALEFYNGPDDWKKVCELKNVDLVYSCTPWGIHTPIAVYAMEHGKHVATEVPAATTVEECWQLVNTSEKTRKHCMMLENCCYDFFEMATLNMAQKGIFGEIVHVEGAYIHDLRFLNFESPANGGYQDMWRLKLSENHTGNPYPTHGLGPVCQALNIHRGDKMNTLVSMSSNQFGMTKYAKQKYGENADSAKINYDLGDMNTTLIRTQKGKTIMIQHDVTSPRPYNRIHMISGTKGFAQKYPIQGIALDPAAHNFLPQAQMDSMLKVYEHPIVKEMGEKAKKVGGHGGMDFIMDSRLIYCLRNGLPLDQDVYDAAEWSCLTQLSELSVRNGSIPVKMPDFTRGDWKKLNGLQFAK